MNIRPLSEELSEHDRFEAERMAHLTSDYSKADRHEHAPFGGCECSAGLVRCSCGACWPPRRGGVPYVADALPQDFDQGERTGRHRRMGMLAAWERGLLQPAVRQSVGWFTVMAFLLAAFRYWSN